MAHSTFANAAIPFALALMAAAGAGCVGEIGGDAPSPSLDPSGVLSCNEVQAFEVPMRRLTKVQYENTIRDLFSGEVTPSARFPNSNPNYTYPTHAAANSVNLLAATSIMEAAEDVALQVIERISQFAPCADEGEACAERVLGELLPKIYRRPARPEEIGDLMQVYRASESADFAIRFGTAVSAALQMPQFVYLVEEGDGPPDARGRMVLSQHEIASRLSYFLWGSMPDAELFDAAEAGRLESPDEILDQARRLISDRERSRPVVLAFFRAWLGVADFPQAAAKSAEKYPDFPSQSALMSEELDRFLENAFYAGGTVESLLNGRTTFVNDELAAFYGVEGPSGGGWGPVEIPRRPGVLTRAAVMARYAHTDNSALILRGKMVRTRLLCQTIGPPPPAAMNFDFPAGLTNRERSELLLRKKDCTGCHTLMNPIGHALENFDAVGAWIGVDEKGERIDAAGEITGTEDANGTFTGPEALMDLLAGSEEVAACVIENMFTYSAGRDADEHDTCTLENLARRTSSSQHRLDDVLLSITQTQGFVRRRVQGGGE
jgi:hypothetical protein